MWIHPFSLYKFTHFFDFHLHHLYFLSLTPIIMMIIIIITHNRAMASKVRHCYIVPPNDMDVRWYSST